MSVLPEIKVVSVYVRSMCWLGISFEIQMRINIYAYLCVIMCWKTAGFYVEQWKIVDVFCVGSYVNVIYVCVFVFDVGNLVVLN